jgi:hypothetical protein
VQKNGVTVAGAAVVAGVGVAKAGTAATAARRRLVKSILFENC